MKSPPYCLHPAIVFASHVPSFMQHAPLAQKIVVAHVDPGPNGVPPEKLHMIGIMLTQLSSSGKVIQQASVGRQKVNAQD